MVGRISCFFLTLVLATQVLAIPHPPKKDIEIFKPLKIDISVIEPGAMKFYNWQGLTIAVYLRTDFEVKALNKSNEGITDFYSQNQSKSPYLNKYHDIIDLESEWIKTPQRSRQLHYFVFLLPSPLQGCGVKLNVNTQNDQLSDDPAGWDGAFYDPCDQVYYDFAGRVYNNPKTKNNLYVPHYRFLSDKVIELLPAKE